jgi:anthranilate synthase component 1
MEMKPSLEEFAKLASQGNTVPVYAEILADTETPVSAYLKLRGESPHSFLFESIEGGERQARYSFLGAGPTALFRSTGTRISIEECSSGERREWEGDAIAALRDLMQQYQPVHVAGLPRFTGGAVGYLGYDGIRLVESLPDNCDDDLELEDMIFAVFETIVAFDNYRHTILLIANARPQGDVAAAYKAAADRILGLETVLARPIPPSALAGGRPEGGTMKRVRSNMSKARYEESVSRCLEYIRAGDIFQVVFSQRFQVEIAADPLDIYRVLRTVNPSPYMFNIALDGLHMLGASPEILVRVEDGVIEVRPIAGTRARGATAAQDEALAAELLADDKDRSEHVMLVDLGRNDVGRVAKYNTVRVTEMMAIERYSHVMHIVSNVEGKLNDGMDSIDALFACYPAGTLSGAPKIRAMEIIDELEPTRRGIYGGAIGYLDFSGNLDTCIAIRTMVVKNGTAYIQAGGGIVADSDPHLEYQETVNKAMALLRALEMAERGSIEPSAERIDGLLEGVEPTFLDGAEEEAQER